MDKNNSCMAGCGSFLVLGGAFILTFIGMLEGTGPTPAHRDLDAANALFAIVLVLVGIAIIMARKARIT